MCGIFGSRELKTYEKLYLENKKRGNFAYGSLYICNDKSLHMRKEPGTVSLTGDYTWQEEYSLFLGHTQAPTSVQREFSPRTSHPFEDMYHIVAHNGVLENYDDIVDDILVGHINAVDSSLIPALISFLFEFPEPQSATDKLVNSNKTEEVLAIEGACNTIKGTFACWIYSKLTGCTYLVRSGSTLFANIETGDFSSIRVPGVCDEELAEGTVYCVTPEGLATCGRFDSSSPFFI